MRYAMKTLTSLIALVQLTACRPLLRVKRQAPTATSTQSDYRNPLYDPFPGRSASSFSPIFPLVHSFTNGVKVEPGDDFQLDGFINVPIPGWGLFDLKGDWSHGTTPIEVGVGELVHPVNALNLNGGSLAALAQNPLFQEARRESPTLPVVQLPGGFTPLRCKPPFCNPFLGNIGVGVDVSAANPFFDGNLDFPIPAGRNGLGVRFPIGGGLEFLGNDVSVQYGHQLGPVDPIGDSERAQARTEEDLHRKALTEFIRASGDLEPGRSTALRPSRPRPTSTNTAPLPSLPHVPPADGHLPPIPLKFLRRTA